MVAVNYQERIPNNVGLSDNPRLQRALDSWHPRFMRWWREMGPVGFQEADVFLRTAVDVNAEGWAIWDYVKLPDYRWGIFLAEAEPERRIGFGDNLGGPVWHEVPGEHRNALRRLIVVQGDTEPASVEQQRYLGRTAPSLYDLRNLFQVNVEEGRHLWAMVYLLHAYFGRDGREEADELLERHAGDSDKPRILGAFNEDTPDWLSFFMFTYFTDRDGKFQLAALAESDFDPLSRTCRFMLKEEAHHMFVGTTGIARVVERTAQLMRERDTEDVRPFGGIDLSTIQRYLNFHFSVSLDLFGAETSTNAANYYGAGLKGRFRETQRKDDHRLTDAVYPICEVRDGRVEKVDSPALLAMNACLQDDFIRNCQSGVAQWNEMLERYRIDRRLMLPHRGFLRAVGVFADVRVSPDGRVISEQEWNERVGEWLPTEDDKRFIETLMVPVYEPGKMASWIAPPSKGLHGGPVEFEYVRTRPGGGF